MRITKSEGQAIDKMISDTIINIIRVYSDMDREDAEQATIDILKFLESIGYESGSTLPICDNCNEPIKPTQRKYTFGKDGFSHLDCNFPDE